MKERFKLTASIKSSRAFVIQPGLEQRELQVIGLVGYTISEIKARTTAQGEAMMKRQQIDTAWRLGFRGDYSLIEEMIRPEYLCLDHRMGLEANFESEKVLMKTMSSMVTPGPCKILYENEEIVVTQWFSKFNETNLRYIAIMSTFHVREGKIFRQEVVREPLDYDPSEGQD